PGKTTASAGVTAAEGMTREELFEANPEARAMYEKLQSLKTSVDAIKTQPDERSAEADYSGVSKDPNRSARQAEKIVREKKRAESAEERRRAVERARIQAVRQKEIEEAERRAAEKRREAELMRLKAAEANKQAELAAKAQSQDVEEMIALQSLTQAIAAGADPEAAKEAGDLTAGKSGDHEETAANKLTGQASKAAESAAPSGTADLESITAVLKDTHAVQNETLGQISDITERATMRLTVQQQAEIQRLTSAQEQAKVARDKQRRQLKEELERSRARRKAEEIAARQAQQKKESDVRREASERKAELKRAHIEEEARLKAEKQARAMEAAIAKRARAEKEAAEKHARALAAAKAKEARKAKELEEKRAREEEEARIKEERKEKARQLWRERAEKRQEKRRKRQEEKLKELAQKRELRDEIARYRRAKRAEENEQKRLRQIKEEDAAMGGGLVTVHDVTIKTEINKRENIRFIDLLGIKTREERTAKTDEERMALRREREYRREDARAKFSFNNLIRLRTWQNSKYGKAVSRFGRFCEKHQRVIITSSAAVATVIVSAAAIFNYCTAFEYSYNGTALGLVDNKNDVLDVTELVETAMTRENNMNVIIRAEDITFERVSTIGGADIDTTEDVLKRLTYMGDFKVVSYGIYVDGSKIGAVRTKENARDVLQKLKDEYTKDADKVEVEEAVFLEDVEVKKCSTKLESLRTVDNMVGLLTTDTDKETVHNTIAGETVEDIATEFNTTAAKLIENNAGLAEESTISAGTPVIIKEVAPPVTVKITEKIQYTETIEYETEETKDSEMYQGDKEITQEGEDGSQDITARLVSINGKVIEEKNLETNVTKEPVTKKITVGTKVRPPTVGDGKFSCPIHDSFRKTTGFQMRWGRFHKGVDLACPTGTPVYAADGGTVVTASYKPSYGNLVEIDHQNGYLTKYAHNSKILVNVGDKVYEGQKIALVGSTGNSTGPHCHFEVRDHGEPKNPLNYITLH
ncbi:MAG: peptidoglycan DD-metalloendopeptidase family protein, partial [Firmicutes bacterium]|nr:peptidoglycan DD-metalloendopeptidase family protein [Bacillota bacterium]